jgi:hypothetical protein
MIKIWQEIESGKSDIITNQPNDHQKKGYRIQNPQNPNMYANAAYILLLFIKN